MAVPWTAHCMLEQTLLRQWIKEAKAGDATAFERIMLLHERMVLRTAERLLMNSEDAKDAAQEVFVRLHGKLGQLREEKELIPWLYRVTVNICLDQKRRARRNVRMEHARETADRALDPEQALTLAEEKALVVGALGELSGRERAAIVLRDLEGCTTSEVAQILGSTEVTVRSQISTGRMKIRKFVTAKLRRRT